jgi:hypothetical protein
MKDLECYDFLRFYVSCLEHDSEASFPKQRPDGKERLKLVLVAFYLNFALENVANEQLAVQNLFNLFVFLIAAFYGSRLLNQKVRLKPVRLRRFG